MKTLKSVIALALALILSLSVVSTAFAANVGDTIEWTYEVDFSDYVGIDTYIYEGELVEGTNTVKGETYETPCYTFNVEKSGYYLFSSENGLYVEVSEEIRNGAPYGCLKRLYADGEDIYASDDDYDLFYIPEGTAYVGVDFYGDYADGTLDIEYIGAELTDVNIDENELKDLIKGYDIIYGSGNGFNFATDATLTFDNGTEKTFKNTYIRFDTPDSSEVVEGENIVKTINTFGIEKEYTLTCYSINHYVQKVEISNLDKYLTYKRYYSKNLYNNFGFYTDNDGKGLEGETLTVTLCDGTTQSFVIDWDREIVVELPNGREFNVYMGENYSSYEDKAYFVVMICGVIVFEKECTAIEATAKENLDMLKYRLERRILSLKILIDYYGDMIGSSESVTDTVFYIRRIVEEISQKTKGILVEIGDCCGHLILG